MRSCSSGCPKRRGCLCRRIDTALDTIESVGWSSEGLARLTFVLEDIVRRASPQQEPDGADADVIPLVLK